MKRLTKPTPSCRTSGTFEKYTLSKKYAAGRGLTEIPYSKMTKIIDAAADDTEVVVNLGISFYFDGRAYTTAVVSANGFVVLGGTSFADVMTSEFEPASIYTDISGPYTLLCPWYIDSATLSTTIPTYGPLGGVYLYVDRSSSGPRTIIRWVNMNYVAGGFYLSDGMIIFECVLYESTGKVEFRYSPKITNPGIVVAGSGSAIEPIGGGGVTGVWTSGSNRWRDFTRTNTKFGGATYDPSYTYTEGTQPATPWSYSRRVYSVTSGNYVIPGCWPGGVSFGSVWSLDPPMGSIRRSSRLDLRLLDDTSQISDGGQEYFDDQKTLVYMTASSTQTINFPTTIPALYADRSELAGALNGFRTSLDSDDNSGVVVGASKAASDFAIDVATAQTRLYDSPLPPYNESILVEQGPAFKSSAFYQTGSSVEEYGLGYSQNLGAKCIIRLSFPILSQTLLRPTTASIYYYDPVRKSILEYGTAPRVDPGESYSPGGMVDSIGFTPLGTFCSQVENKDYARYFYRSNNGDGKRHPETAPGFGQLLTTQTKVDSLSGQNGGVITLSSSFSVHTTGSISLKGHLEAPFLLEKAIFRIPLAAGPGWTNDKTRTKRVLGFDDYDFGLIDGPDVLCSGSLFNVCEDWPLDVGGPCVTVGLMNQVTPAIRDLILTGTIIPVADNVTGYNISLTRNQLVVDYDSLTASIKHYSITQEGFRSFGRTPSAVVTPDASGFFTGSVELMTTAVSSNGLVIQPKYVLAPRNTTDMTGSNYIFASGSSSISGLGWSTLTPFSFTGSYWTESVNKITYLISGATGIAIPNPYPYWGRYGNETFKAGDVGPTQQALMGDRILSINPCGRNQSGFSHTGRSIRDVVGLNESDLIVSNPLYPFKDEIHTFITSSYASDGTVHLNDGNHASFEILPDLVHVIESSQYAPYVLLPDDNLIFFMSKCRPVKSASLNLAKGEAGTSVGAIYPGGSATEIDKKYTLLTGSHDIRVYSGSLEIILFGSYMREGIELDNANFKKKVQQTVISEVIGDVPVVDQFESEYRTAYSGTYNGSYITGSFFTWNVDSNTQTKIFTAKERGVASPNFDGNSTLSATDLSTQMTPVRERHTTLLFNQAHDDKERFWDTLLPSVSDIWTADDVNVYYSSDLRMETVTGSTPGFTCSIYYAGPQVLPQTTAYVYSANHNHYEQTASIKFTNMAWPKAFPYEPRYSGINRVSDVASKFTTNKVVTAWGGANFSPSVTEHEFSQTDKFAITSQALYALNLITSTASWTAWNEVYCGLNYFNPSLQGSFFGGDIGQAYYDKREFTKAVFGFATPDPDRLQNGSFWQLGDAVNNDFSSLFFRKTPVRMRSRISRPFTSVPFLALYRYFYYSMGLMIDGWKYGIMNGFRQTSKAVYRRNSFGQFRDMLEQRLDGKFYYEEVEEKCGTYDPALTPSTTLAAYYDSSPYSNKKLPGGSIGQSPVLVKFVGADGSLTDPEKTDSSNLSFEATSSLPFFDDQIRNRFSEWTTTTSLSVGKLAAVSQKSANLNKKIISWSTDDNGNTTLG